MLEIGRETPGNWETCSGDFVMNGRRSLGVSSNRNRFECGGLCLES